MEMLGNEDYVSRLDSPRAWRMVAAAFVSTFVVFGISYSFGAFFKPMATEFGASQSATSAFFSITVFLYSMLGPVAGHLADRFGPKPVLAAGAVAVGAGLVATSSIDRLWVGYLTYGIGMGIGIASAYVPTVAVVGGWFLRRRNTALGVAVAGIGGGTLCMAPIAAALITRIGWREAYAVIGLAGAAMLAMCAWLIERPPVPVAPAKFSIAETLRAPSFMMLYASSFFSSMALFIPFVFLPGFARDHGASEVAAATLVGLIGGASVVGRMGMGAIADRLGVVRLYQICFFVLALSYLIWLAASSYPILVLFALVMGVGYGGYVALSPAVLAELFGTQSLGAVLGALYTGGGVGALIGPPSAGFVIDHTGGYRWAIALAFVISSMGWVSLIPLELHPPAPAIAIESAGDG